MYGLPFYLLLTPSGAAARLALLRKANPTDWRAARPWRFDNYRGAYALLSQGFNDGKPVWYDHNGPYFRGERFADEIENSPIDHSGWFTDVEGSETCRGIVCRLPHGRFITGYYWNSNGERVYFPEVFTDEREAARRADDHARAFAEDAQEHDAKFQEFARLEDKLEDDKKRLIECLALRHNKCLDYIRDEIAELIARIRETRETIKTSYAEFI